jgi:hypothetical protein
MSCSLETSNVANMATKPANSEDEMKRVMNRQNSVFAISAALTLSLLADPPSPRFGVASSAVAPVSGRSPVRKADASEDP